MAVFPRSKETEKESFFQKGRLFVDGTEVFQPGHGEEMETNARSRYEQLGARPKENQRPTRPAPRPRR